MCVNVVDVCVICEWSLFICVRVVEVSVRVRVLLIYESE